MSDNNYPAGVTDDDINRLYCEQDKYESETCGTCDEKHPVPIAYLNKRALEIGVSWCPWNDIYVEDTEEACDFWCD